MSGSDAGKQGGYVCMAAPRSGLGNLLRIWAATEAVSSVFGVPVVAPRWTRLGVGPLLRGETDLRLYLGQLRPLRHHVGGREMRRVLRRVDTALDPELDLTPGRRALPADLEGRVLSISRMLHPDYFPLHRDHVAPKFLRMLSPKVRAEADRFDQPLEIVVHVRRGDVEVIGPGEELPKDYTVRAESEYYYRRVIEAVRGVLGERAPVTVFTNAKPGELRELPSIPGVEIARGKRSAAADMLLMSRARVLIASSASSFSTWASYVGGMPTVYHRPHGKLVVPGREDLVIEVSPDGELGDEQGAAIARGGVGPPPEAAADAAT